jgi:predicted transcriptional regulator
MVKRKMTWTKLEINKRRTPHNNNTNTTRKCDKYYFYKLLNIFIIQGKTLQVYITATCHRRVGQIKDDEIDICCFSAKHAALGRKNRDCMVGSESG